MTARLQILSPRPSLIWFFVIGNSKLLAWLRAGDSWKIEPRPFSCCAIVNILFETGGRFFFSSPGILVVTHEDPRKEDLV
jgi:hypothetical protein